MTTTVGPETARLREGLRAFLLAAEQTVDLIEIDAPTGAPTDAPTDAPTGAQTDARAGALAALEEQLDGAQSLLMDAIYPAAERRLDEEASARQVRVQARALRLDELQMKIDERVSRVVHALTQENGVIARIAMELFVLSVVELSARCPEWTWRNALTGELAESSLRDPRVAAVMQTLTRLFATSAGGAR